MNLVPVSLRHFLEVAPTGSISEASERLHVATSAISRQIWPTSSPRSTERQAV